MVAITRDDSLVEISFKGPSSKIGEAIKNMVKLGFSKFDAHVLDEAINESVPWREVFPTMSMEQESGVTLRETRKLVGFTQKQLSDLTEIPQRHISEMECAKRPIGKENAKKLATALDVDYRIFL
jgi:hypothetical protein